MANEPHDVWLHIRTIMGCAILTMEDRTTGRKVETSYALVDGYERDKRYRQAIERLDEALGWPIRSRWD